MPLRHKTPATGTEAPVSRLVTAEYPACKQQLLLLFASDHVDIGVRDPETGQPCLYRLHTEGKRRAEQEAYALAFIDRHQPCLVDGALSLRFQCLPDGTLLPIVLLAENVAPMSALMRAQAFRDIVV